MNSAWDYKGQPSIWLKDAELKAINIGKQLGIKRREQIKQKEAHIDHNKKARKIKK